jgi:DNA repair protein RadA/Sms
MSKVKSAYFCQNCGHEAPKWLGKCPSCSEWNTFVEEIIEKNIPSVVAFSSSTRNAKPQAIHTIENQEHVRLF